MEARGGFLLPREPTLRDRPPRRKVAERAQTHRPWLSTPTITLPPGDRDQKNPRWLQPSLGWAQPTLRWRNPARPRPRRKPGPGAPESSPAARSPGSVLGAAATKACGHRGPAAPGFALAPFQPSAARIKQQRPWLEVPGPEGLQEDETSSEPAEYTVRKATGPGCLGVVSRLVPPLGAACSRDRATCSGDL